MVDLAFIERKKKFCKRHAAELETIHCVIRSSKGSAGWWKDSLVKRLIKQARKQIRYSTKTIDLDIINSLYKCHRREE